MTTKWEEFIHLNRDVITLRTSQNKASQLQTWRAKSSASFLFYLIVDVLIYITDWQESLLIPFFRYQKVENTLKPGDYLS